MRNRWIATLGILTALGLGIALSTCTPRTDLGKDCFLVRRNPAYTPDGGGPTAVNLLEKDIKPSMDFISFGSVECEDLVCVRDLNYVPGPMVKPEDNAKGYCSRACTAGTVCPAMVGADDANPAKSLSCRALLLDDQTLVAIKTADPATFQKYFGATLSPFFCARGTARVDAGP